MLVPTRRAKFLTMREEMEQSSFLSQELRTGLLINRNHAWWHLNKHTYASQKILKHQCKRLCVKLLVLQYCVDNSNTLRIAPCVSEYDGSWSTMVKIWHVGHNGGHKAIAGCRTYGRSLLSSLRNLKYCWREEIKWKVERFDFYFVG